MMELTAVIIISEIMYNPASSEELPVRTEWVELYNPTDQAVELAGWYLQDEDGRTGPIPEHTTLDPGAALVLIPGEQAVEAFREAWGGAGDEDDGRGYQVVPLQDWGAAGLYNLANSPSAENEILTLRRPDESVSDEVNYDDSDPWPSDNPAGHSIYLLPEHLDPDANDDGAHWAASKVDRHEATHARNAGGYDAGDLGSPGVVVTETDANDRPTQTARKQETQEEQDDP